MSEVKIKHIIGKVYKTKLKYNECECGEIVDQQFVYEFRNGNLGNEFAVGICKCGNVFLTDFNNN